MKTLSIILFVSVLSTGCADTPNNRQLWTDIGAGLQSGVQEQQRQLREMRSTLNNQPMPRICTYTVNGNIVNGHCH